MILFLLNPNSEQRAIAIVKIKFVIKGGTLQNVIDKLVVKCLIPHSHQQDIFSHPGFRQIKIRDRQLKNSLNYPWDSSSSR